MLRFVQRGQTATDRDASSASPEEKSHFTSSLPQTFHKIKRRPKTRSNPKNASSRPKSAFPSFNGNPGLLTRFIASSGELDALLKLIPPRKIAHFVAVDGGCSLRKATPAEVHESTGAGRDTLARVWTNFRRQVRGPKVSTIAEVVVDAPSTLRVIALQGFLRGAEVYRSDPGDASGFRIYATGLGSGTMPGAMDFVLKRAREHNSDDWTVIEAEHSVDVIVGHNCDEAVVSACAKSFHSTCIEQFVVLPGKAEAAPHVRALYSSFHLFHPGLCSPKRRPRYFPMALTSQSDMGIISNLSDARFVDVHVRDGESREDFLEMLLGFEDETPNWPDMFEPNGRRALRMWFASRPALGNDPAASASTRALAFMRQCKGLTQKRMGSNAVVVDGHCSLCGHEGTRRHSCPYSILRPKCAMCHKGHATHGCKPISDKALTKDALEYLKRDEKMAAAASASSADAHTDTTAAAAAAPAPSASPAPKSSVPAPDAPVQNEPSRSVRTKAKPATRTQDFQSSLAKAFSPPMTRTRAASKQPSHPPGPVPGGNTHSRPPG